MCKCADRGILFSCLKIAVCSGNSITTKSSTGHIGKKAILFCNFQHACKVIRNANFFIFSVNTI